jgi:uncharacterized MAPEG superfamily protein
MTNAHETAQSMLSYGAAGSGLALATWVEHAAGVAQSVTIVLACLVVVVRLVYDTTRLIRYLKDKGKPYE